MEIENTTFSILIMLITFLITFAFSNAYRSFKNTKISSFVRCMAGGLIVATLLFHIIPDLYEEKKYQQMRVFLCGSVFILLFAIDKFVLCCHEAIPEKASVRKATVFIAALSVHSFLEGLGCSVMAKNSQRTAYCVSLLGHKWIEAFVIGVSIGNAAFAKRTALFLTLFYSALTPVGILVGLAATNVDIPFIESVLNGLSCGSFFYIGFLEMLVGEFREKEKDDKKKMVAVMVGFLIMCGVSTVLMDDASFKQGK